MGGGDGGDGKQTTTTQAQLPAWLIPYAKTYLSDLAKLVPGMGGIEQYLQQALQQTAATASGAYLDPASNPWLQKYYEAAAGPVKQAVKATAEMSGGLGGTPEQGQMAKELGNLAAQIYEPAYQYERGLQQRATGMLPQMAYLPLEMLGGGFPALSGTGTTVQTQTGLGGMK